MGEQTAIEWCDHTWNPWLGCTKVSNGPTGACNNCYAEDMMDTRYGRVRWGVGQRFYWVADADDAEWWSERAPWHDGEWPKTGRVKGDRHAGHGGADGWLANADGGLRRDRGLQSGGQYGQLAQDGRPGRMVDTASRRRGVGPSGERHLQQPDEPGALGGLEYSPGIRWGQERPNPGWGIVRGGTQGWPAGPSKLGAHDVDWLLCRDGAWRPVEPGTCPLVDATPARMGRLRLYGDAIDAEAAANFIGAYMDAAPASVAA